MQLSNSFHPARAAAVVLILVAAGRAGGQTFVYPDFSSLAGLAFNGSAGPAGNVLRLTPAAYNQAGSVYYGTRVSVSGGFDTSFTFRLTNQLGAGADGMVFLLHDDPRGTVALGTGGAWMAYGGGGAAGLQKVLALELDTWYNAWPLVPDLNNNEISLHANANVIGDPDERWSLGRVTALPYLMAGQVHTVRITYVPGALSVYLDNLVTPLFTAAYDLGLGGVYLNNSLAPGLQLASQGAWVGFCASTGGAAQNHDVLSWQWSSWPATLTGTGTGSIGSTFTLNLDSQSTPGVPYLLALAAGSQPGIVLPDNRVIPLNPDAIFSLSLQPGIPNFAGFSGLIGPPGSATASAAILIPAAPSLIGLTIYSAFVTGDPLQVWGIGAISNALAITFTT